MNDFLASMKGASQRIVGSVADAGAKTMLKTDMAFLERDIKARKQAFGIIAYDFLEKSENSGGGGDDDVRKAFEECRGDIFALESKLGSKKREMDAIDASHGGGAGAGGGGGVGEDAEAPGIPQNP